MAVVGRLGYIVAYVWLPLKAAVQLGWTTSTKAALAILAFTIMKRAMTEYAPQNMQFLSRNYIERKFGLRNLICAMHRMDAMTLDEVQVFRTEALRMIAQYVRDHRADWEGRSIFANLLIEDGPELVVLARNEPHRLPMARYQKSGMAAASVFQDGEPVVVSDLAAQYPDSSDKSYRSILVLPINLGDAVVGAVSIDSESRYHFDGAAASLWNCLVPYTSLLAWTLQEKHVRHVRSFGQP